MVIQLLTERGHKRWRRYTLNQFELHLWACLRNDAFKSAAEFELSHFAIAAGIGSIAGPQAGEAVKEAATQLRSFGDAKPNVADKLLETLNSAGV